MRKQNSAVNNVLCQIIVLCFLVLITKNASCNCYHFKKVHRYHEQHFLTIRQLQIKNEIKEALKHVADNETLENVIPKMFNLTNPDPTYVFLLPNGKQKRLIMRKSDFQKAIFPKLSKVYIRLSRMTKKNPPFERANDFRVQKPLDYVFDKIQHNFENEEKIVSRIMENVQTERNFIDYVHKLNEKVSGLPNMNNFDQEFDLIGSESKKHKKYYAYLPKYQGVSKNSEEKEEEQTDWDELGLSGWSGQLSILSEQYTVNRNSNPFGLNPPTQIKQHSETTQDKISDAIGNTKSEVDLLNLNADNFATPLQYNFLDDPQDNNIWDLPGKVSNNPVKLLNIENETLSKMSGVLEHYKNPKWPIASTRNSHKNGDVFIARANDPFGYSTKWKLRNSTNERNGPGEERKKRAIVELYSMLKCSTGCDPLLYKGYGCYCGFLGSGQPTDGIDKCCQSHDRCYDASGCFAFQQYFVPYIWKCYGGQPVCAADHGEWGGPGSCASKLCKCDLALAMCLRKYYCPRKRAVCTTSKFRLLQNFLLIF